MIVINKDFGLNCTTIITVKKDNDTLKFKCVDHGHGMPDLSEKVYVKGDKLFFDTRNLYVKIV